tara:strand:- start:1556 stop:1987 length:432 start_codon:yes stop_codon:yes gene_type:complete
VNKLNPHTLFSIFEKGDEEVYKENQMEGLLDNPYVLIGMVVSGVENYYFIDEIYSNKDPKRYAKVKNNIKYKYFTKVFKYLTRLSLDELDTKYGIGTDYELDRSINALNDLLFYFEDIEEYEKCALIFQYTDLLYSKKLQNLI